MKLTKTYRQDGTRYRITADAKLHYIKGNKLPYFSVTGEIDRQARNNQWVEESGGCLHQEIAEHFPQLETLIALHLADMTGRPMYAIENGWFNYANPDRHQYLASHLRISESEARELLAQELTREQFAEYVNVRVATWWAEARAAIEFFNLLVEGDEWVTITHDDDGYSVRCAGQPVVTDTTFTIADQVATRLRGQSGQAGETREIADRYLMSLTR